MQSQTRRFPAMMGTVAAAMLMAFLSTVALSQGEEPTAQPPQSSTMITFERAVHFSTPDGADVTIPAGRYDVAPGGKEQLNLMPVDAGATGKAWPILASPITVPVQLTAAAAVSLSSDNDQHQVMWVRPNGSALEAIGSYSGMITRNLCDEQCQLMKAQQKAQQRAMMMQILTNMMKTQGDRKKSITDNIR